MPKESWALTQPHSAEAKIRESGTGYSLKNGKLTVHRTRRLYLPQGASWTNLDTKETFPGGQWITAPAPLDTMPVLKRI